MNLRPYQHNVVDCVERGFESFDRQLVVIPTGGGKTIVFSHLAQRRAQRGERTLILAHREELIDQAIDKLHRATGIKAGKEKAECEASATDTVVVGSIQTLLRRCAKWSPNHFSLIVCDEAHHAISDSWQTVLRHFTGAQVLGVTATPDRGDKRCLGQYFQNIAAEVGLFDLIRDGYLSRIVLKSVPLEITLSGVKQVAGDYDAGALGDALTPYLGAIAEAIKEHASFRRTLVFVPLIHTSQMFVNVCRSVGLSAAHVDGTSTDRREVLQRFAAGEFDVLSNAMLLTEGFDDPGIDCVVVLRPTRSRALYSQMVGRGTRTAPELGKENLLLLDFLWMHERHNLIRPAHLVAKSDEEADTITTLAQQKASDQRATSWSQEPLELEGLASEAAEKRHEVLRRQLDQNKRKKGKLMDAMDWCLSKGQDDLADYEPTMKWESSPMTDAQIRCLKSAGVDPATVSGRGQASKLIEVIKRNERLTLASDKVRGLMKRMGSPNWERATVQEGRQFMASLRR